MSLTDPFSLIGNQLDNGQGNLVKDIFGTTGIPVNTKVYKFNGISYDTLTYQGAPFNRWNPTTLADTMTMAPGEGVFVSNPSSPTPINVTFVGEVMQGTLVNPVSTGFGIYSAMVPEEGGIQSVHNYVPSPNDKVYRFDGIAYATSTYRGAPFNSWSAPGEPVLTVGEAVFIQTSVAKDWSRDFTVQ
jgi:hypothetical protein